MVSARPARAPGTNPARPPPCRAPSRASGRGRASTALVHKLAVPRRQYGVRAACLHPGRPPAALLPLPPAGVSSCWPHLPTKRGPAQALPAGWPLAPPRARCRGPARPPRLPLLAGWLAVEYRHRRSGRANYWGRLGYYTQAAAGDDEVPPYRVRVLIPSHPPTVARPPALPRAAACLVALLTPSLAATGTSSSGCSGPFPPSWRVRPAGGGAS